MFSNQSLSSQATAKLKLRELDLLAEIHSIQQYPLAANANPDIYHEKAYALAVVYLESHKYQEAFAWLTKAILLGSITAKNDLIYEKFLKFEATFHLSSEDLKFYKTLLGSIILIALDKRDIFDDSNIEYLYDIYSNNKVINYSTNDIAGYMPDRIAKQADIVVDFFDYCLSKKIIDPALYERILKRLDGRDPRFSSRDEFQFEVFIKYLGENKIEHALTRLAWVQTAYIETELDHIKAVAETLDDSKNIETVNKVIQKRFDNYVYQASLKDASNYALFKFHCRNYDFAKAQTHVDKINLHHLARQMDELKNISQNIQKPADKNQFNAMLLQKFNSKKYYYNEANVFANAIPNITNEQQNLFETHLKNLYENDQGGSNYEVTLLKKSVKIKLNKDNHSSDSNLSFATPLSKADEIRSAIRNCIALLQEYFFQRELRKNTNIFTLLRFLPGEISDQGDARENYVKTAESFEKSLKTTEKDIDLTSVLTAFQAHIENGKRLFPEGLISAEMDNTFGEISSILEKLTYSISSNSPGL